jgi:hypothetical protein
MADAAAAAAAAAAASLGPGPGIPIPGPGGPGGIPIPIPGAPVPNRPFALTPALLEGRYLDYSSQPDVKLHYKAIRLLTVKFDLTPGNMVEFCNDFIRVPTARARESAEQANLVFSAAYEVLATYLEPEIADKMENPIAFLAKSDLDTLYCHQAMKAADAKEF